jgi:oxygen-independent coproporphyrinogen-3 oxidase
MALSTPPLALYLHFPWCVRKCPYCDFNSHALKGELDEARYVDVLLADLAIQAELAAARPIVSVFMGGGTPSLFSPAAIGRVLEGARALFAFAPDAEITMEANPGTIERHRFADYRAAGVNRVSLGAQSFASEQLMRLGRIHEADDTCRGAEELHAAGLANFNLDLMYALPAQTVAGALADLEAALALAPAHISHYQLTLEPGTVFGGLPPPDLPDDDNAERMMQLCQQRLAAAGYQHYEVSAHARAGARSRHNVNYWQFGDYLGVGAGAHGKASHAATGAIVRTTREREPRRYLAEGGQVVPLTQPVPASQLPFEFMLNALRLVEGFPLADFTERTGLPVAVILPQLARAEDAGLIERDHVHVRPTPRGRRFLNDLLEAFLPTGPSRPRKVIGICSPGTGRP